jgi:hypothetical protein
LADRTPASRQPNHLGSVIPPDIGLAGAALATRSGQLFASLYAPTPQPVKVGILCFLLIRVLLSIPFLRWLGQEPAIDSSPAAAQV